MIDGVVGNKLVTALYRYRKVLVVLVQLGLVVASYVASFVLRLDLDLGRIPVDVILKTLPLLIIVRMGTLAVFHLYQGLWRYVGVPDLLQIIKATTVSSLLFAALELVIFGPQGFPRSVFFLDWAGNIFLLSGTRLIVRVFRERFRPIEGLDGASKGASKRLLIIGAGDAGAALCAQVLSTTTLRYKPVAFVDGDRRKVGNTILGVPVAGRWEDITRVIGDYRVDSAVIAIPSPTPSEMRSLVGICQTAQVPFKVLPATSDLLDGTVSISRIREVDPVDLLGRPPARLDRAAIQSFVRGRRILITGAAGSVGSELATQIAGLRPDLLVLIDHAENPLFFLESEIRDTFPDVSVAAQVSDVTDEDKMSRVMTSYRPQVVFHAAAHKHVPLMERTPEEAVKNNVGGVYVMAKCAQMAGVEILVLVSTDKAVKPSSVMGASKRLAELLIQEINEQKLTRFTAVRFGNVVGSNASVVPIFKRQIANGGPLTVTHPDATRYFMSVSEAAGLILQAGAVGTGGEVFVLDMGEPLRIVTLAETMITLSGLKPYEDIDIVFIGLRPGEKLSEELNFDGEEFRPTGYEKLLVLRKDHHPPGVVARVEEFLGDLATLEPEEVKSRLRSLVPEYQPSSPPDDGDKASLSPRPMEDALKIRLSTKESHHVD